MASNHLPVCCCDDGADCEEDPHDALLDTICGFYVEVLDRLPIQEHPKLVHRLLVAGHCYGLLEPVSNIILHAIAHGPSNGGRYTREDITSEFMDRIHNRRYWLLTAQRSLDGLTTFLMNMYRYLTKDQAVRYLCLAQADIQFAVRLIEREFHSKCRVAEALPPHFDDSAWVPKVEDAVTYAALAAEHPNPRRLVALATTTFGAGHVDKLAAWLRADRIDKDAVEDMYESLIRGRSPDGQYLYSLRVSYPETGAADDDARMACHRNQKTCIHRCPSLLKNKTGWDSDDVAPCGYIKRIEALLVDYIHALHLSAISRLSPDAVKALHRGLVVAGYLCGPLGDPIFNILVNAIWYQLNVPASDYDDCMPTPPVDVICTDRMLRNGFNSLTSQVLILCSKYGMSSGHEAMEYLYFTNCNLFAAMELAEEAGHRAIIASGDDISAATEAAIKAMKHPRPAAMMSLITSFTPELEAKLCDLLPAKGHELSCEGINQISGLLSSYVTLPTMMTPAITTTMHKGAVAEITQKRRAVDRKQRFIMDMVQSLLDKNYEVHTICAVARIDFQKMQMYHVNFFATRTDADDGDRVTSVLFFAQILSCDYPGWTLQENYSCLKDCEQSFCCPVTISSCLGRCFPCEFRRAKIVHPIGSGVEYYGRQEKTYLNFINYIASSPHRVYNYMMDSDYVYFDPSVDTELAKYLNECAKQEEMTDEEA